MARFGVPATALMPGPGRAPAWPDPVVGSITHTRRVCAVAVGARTAYRGIGIDLEPDESIKPGLFRMICTPPELEALGALPEAERGRACRIIFCAKEAAYKAQFSITEQFLPFSAMSIRLGDTEFEAVLNVSVGEHFEVGHIFTGRHRSANELIATAVVLER
jgi:4'-phosphopantetheinyl transferase EntD